MQIREQREAFERHLAGHSVREISADLREPLELVRFAIRQVGLSGWRPLSAEHLPSQGEIRRETLKIQATWSKRKEKSRRIIKPFPFDFPIVSERDLMLDLGFDPLTD